MFLNHAYRAIYLVIYLAVMAAVVIALFQLRKTQLQTLDQPAARQDWQDWRTSAANQSGPEGPVQRDPPQADEPPALILLRDFFPAVLVGSVVICSALYAFFAFVIHGLMKRPELPYVDRDAKSQFQRNG